jgi:hypothetical protein
VKYLYIISLAAILSSSAIYHAPIIQYEKEYTLSSESSESIMPPTPLTPLTPYDIAVRGTIVSADLLQAIALVESGERDDAVGPDGLDHGRFQLRALYHAERSAKWGNFDPFDPVQSARIAALILEENYRALGSWPLAISAYNRGISGTKKRGIATNYLKKVRLSLNAMRHMR